MSGRRNRYRGPRQVIHRTRVEDASGLGRLPHTRGFGRLLAFLGLFIMLGGLAVFGFAIISVLAEFSATRDIPPIPQMAPIGFGVAAVGAIMLQIGLAIGVPPDTDREGDINYYDIDQGIYAEDGGQIRIDHYNPSVQIINQRLEAVDRLYDALEELPLPDDQLTQAEAAVASLRRAVDRNADQQDLERRLDRLANILYGVGALTGGATAVVGGLIQVAQLLGPAGRKVYDWLTAPG